MNIEKGKHKPSFETAIRLLNALGVDVKVFLDAIGYVSPQKGKKVAGGGFEPPATANKNK
jgi:transcriptional regulator with XRE-family HTH domain